MKTFKVKVADKLVSDGTPSRFKTVIMINRREEPSYEFVIRIGEHFRMINAEIVSIGPAGNVVEV